MTNRTKTPKQARAVKARTAVALPDLKAVERMKLRDSLIAPEDCRYLSQFEIAQVILNKE